MEGESGDVSICKLNAEYLESSIRTSPPKSRVPRNNVPITRSIKCYGTDHPNPAKMIKRPRTPRGTNNERGLRKAFAQIRSCNGKR
ncbi:hypothetical protein RSAG8_00830, partial [Rhizoctonia solani AG-8 WAC10335]